MCAGGTSNCPGEGGGNEAGLGHVAQEEECWRAWGCGGRSGSRACDLWQAGGPHTVPVQTFEHICRKAQVFPVSDSELPSFGEKHFRQGGIFPPPWSAGRRERGFPADGQWESHLPHVGHLQAGCCPPSLASHLRVPSEGAWAGLLAPPPGQNPKLSPVTGWVPGETLGCFQSEGGHSRSGRP